ncbi:hypothetical protein PINS_up020306 [Pythium insidiosum]|nr:hypothetical protein PINS_up020306 [Pythium insidiosum]
MCNNKNCKVLLQAVVDAKLPACTVSYNGQTQNIQDIIKTYQDKVPPARVLERIAVERLLRSSARASFECVRTRR